MGKHYVDKDSLRLEMIASNIDGKLTAKALAMLVLMVDRRQSSFKYVRIQDKEDCRSHAIEIVLKKWDRYDASRHNPFSYFTSVITNGLYAGWKEINKHREDFSTSNIFTESV